jgi:hypothetical protein
VRSFKLRRLADETGVSGTGIVAEGVEFTNGEATLSWLTKFRSIGVYPSVKTLMDIHGHGGKTVLEWDEPNCHWGQAECTCDDSEGYGAGV